MKVFGGQADGVDPKPAIGELSPVEIGALGAEPVIGTSLLS